MTVALSRLYAELRTTTPATWRKIVKREICDECVARQFETRGVTRRSPARTSRTTNSSVLHLCVAHAELWKERDRGE
jgi:hypothetical protein